MNIIYYKVIINKIFADLSSVLGAVDNIGDKWKIMDKLAVVSSAELNFPNNFFSDNGF